jgi:serine protease Do
MNHAMVKLLWGRSCMTYKNAIVALTLLCSSFCLAADQQTATTPKSKCGCSPQEIAQAASQARSIIAKKAIPGVVFIKVELESGEDGSFPFSSGDNPFNSPDEDFNRFFGIPFGRPMPPQPQVGQGSGFFVTADGYIFTNAHVVKGANKIDVTLDNGQVLPATLIGADPNTDIAVIKLEGKNFPFLTFGNSDELEIAEDVIAIGSPFALEASVTRGIVSGKKRQLQISDYEDFIQTDAAINPGNSGGPLLNLRGEVVGINTVIISRSGGFMGIGLAIPSNMAKSIMHQLIEKGSVTRGFLGVTLQPVDKDIAAGFNLDKAEGALVADVSKGSPAEEAGLKQGDIILEYNGNPIKTFQAFRNDIALMAPGTVVKLKVNRKNKILNISVTLGSLSTSNSSPGVLDQKLGMEVQNLTPNFLSNLVIIKENKGLWSRKSNQAPQEQWLGSVQVA